MSAIMEKVNVNGADLDRLREVCREKVESDIAKNQEYIIQTKICADIFRQLEKILPGEQRILLFKYDEATALKETLLIDSIISKVL